MLWVGGWGGGWGDVWKMVLKVAFSFGNSSRADLSLLPLL